VLWIRSLWLAIRAEAASPVALISGIVMMIFNDGFWIAFWAVMMNEVETIRGWDLSQILVLFAVFAGALGLVAGVFAGVRELGRMQRRGDYDVLLSQPRAVLPRVLTSHVTPMLFGDLIFGPILLALVVGWDPVAYAKYAAAVLVASVLILGFLIIVGSSVFWLRREEFSDTLFMISTVLGMYPATIFGGPAKFIVYAVIPTAFMTTLPAQYVTGASWTVLAQSAAVAALCMALGVAIFQIGLSQYQRNAYDG
jgi:ABC-2 type transport system permease protein